MPKLQKKLQLPLGTRRNYNLISLPQQANSKMPLLPREINLQYNINTGSQTKNPFESQTQSINKPKFLSENFIIHNSNQTPN
jgi:hypothetical protein